MDYKILLSNLYHDLVLLYENYHVAFDELVNGFEFLKSSTFEQEWIIRLCSPLTLEVLVHFSNGWLYLLKSKPYACIGVFMELDEDWKELRGRLLLQAIEHIKNDLIRHNYQTNFGELSDGDTAIDEAHLLRVVSLLTKRALQGDTSINPWYEHKPN